MSLIETADIIRGFKKKKDFFDIIKKPDFMMFPAYSSGNLININFTLGGTPIEEENTLIYSQEIYNPTKKYLLSLAEKISTVALHEENIIDVINRISEKIGNSFAVNTLKSIVNNAQYLNMFPSDYLLAVPDISSQIYIFKMLQSIYCWKNGSIDTKADLPMKHTSWDHKGVYTIDDILSNENVMIVKFIEKATNEDLIKSLDGSDLGIVEYYHDVFKAFHVNGEKYTVISIPEEY